VLYWEYLNGFGTVDDFRTFYFNMAVRAQCSSLATCILIQLRHQLSSNHVTFQYAVLSSRKYT